MRAVILAAGVGSRINSKSPKCLTKLPNHQTILGNQIEIIRKNGVTEIIVVVGFKKELIMEENPEVLYRYNPLFHISNTAKSLMLAMEKTDEDDLIWLNGDVYLENEVLSKVINRKGNTVAVNKAECSLEEIKYKTDKFGYICQISKKITNGEGEAVGVNKISKKNYAVFLNCLKKCSQHSYFEKGIEFSIEEGLKFLPVDISDYKCVEIDSKKDLDKVYSFI